MLKTIILITFVKLSVATLVGRCNQCFDSNNVACLNETHFVTCFQGTGTPTITKCPDNRFCTDDMLICRSSAEKYMPACYHADYCGECLITNGVFTCMNETTYGYCFGGKTPLESTLRSCPPEYVCNYNSAEVCVPEAANEPSCGTNTMDTTEISTTPTESIIGDTASTTTKRTIQTTKTTEINLETTTKMPTTIEIVTTITQETGYTMETSTTSTTAPKTEARSADIICAEIGRTGYFKSDDPTCRQYVYCYPLSGQYLGWFYYCHYYFNIATQKCQNERPVNCVAY